MEYYARQGEVSVFKIADDKLPDWPELARENGQMIVGHSETGHHHVIERPEAVKIVQKPDGGAMSILRMIVSEPTRIIHQRDTHTHTPIPLDPGVYEVRGQIERDPYADAIRRAAD